MTAKLPETFEDVIALVAQGEMTLIDVRDPEEIKQSGKARGALVIPMAEFSTKTDPTSPDFIDSLTTAKPVALYCASGVRSGVAAQIMMGHGFDACFNIGGFADWVRAGGPVG